MENRGYDMTEAQAKTKWCPQMRKVQWFDEDGNTVNPPLVGNGYNCFCLASGCMLGCNEAGEWQGFCGLNNTSLASMAQSLLYKDGAP
jgi:hypothetical protein